MLLTNLVLVGIPKISVSVCCVSSKSVGMHMRTTSMGGDGFLFLHKLEMVQVTFLKKGMVIPDRARVSRGSTTPLLITKSRNMGPSPAMLPKAQTACKIKL